MKRAPVAVSLLIPLAHGLAQGCSATSPNGPPSTGGADAGTEAGVGGDSDFSDAGKGDAFGCDIRCSPDLHSVIDCQGKTVQQCSGTEGCDVESGACIDACVAAIANRQSVGCEYYATNMDQFEVDVCFAAFVANTWNVPAHLEVEYAGKKLPLDGFARLSSGAGPTLKYEPIPGSGLPPGEVAILFLAGSPGSVAPCPVPPAMPSGSTIFNATRVGDAFRITSDVPVVAYEINPYGGGYAGTTGASLLLPTSVWDTNYVAVTASPKDASPPSMNVIASQDDTTVTMLPVVPVQGGGTLPPGDANVPYVFKLNKGEHAQLTQAMDLSGSILQADKPIGFMAGQPCMSAPFGVKHCDHGEQMIPPIKTLGHEYVGVMFRPRVPGDQGIWRIVATIDDTELTYSTAVGGPAKMKAGESVTFVTEKPFTVKSQDADHPFMLFTYMSGSTWKPGMEGYGDADFVISVPPAQYLSEYVFFTDPTYPEANLVLVRARNDGKFEDVSLDCAGVVTGWQPVGDYEWTRVDLITHDFAQVGNCTSGRRKLSSKGRFGLWVWGWGTPETSSFTASVSYGYPGGMRVQPINGVIIPPVPK